MKKALLIVFFYTINLLSAPISEQYAKNIATNFLKNQNLLQNTNSEIELTYKCDFNSVNSTLRILNNPITYYYVFNKGDKGFVVVSGDDAIYPILGYSDETNFNPLKIPNVVAKWLEGYKEQIRYAIVNNIEATHEISNKWRDLQLGLKETEELQSSVAPLVKTKWDQAPYVNDLCPYDNSYKELTVTGCPATAMAQILKYWNYPEKGSGFHSYSHSKYGTLSANLSATTYNWAAMPNEVKSTNSAVATLMYQCGVAVEMNYNVGAEGGSGSYVIIDKLNRYPVEQTCENAFKTYFGYMATIRGLSRDDYSDSDWIALLKNELNANRPIQYAGYGQGGHTFVCDGYDNNDFFHINWGWGGMFDGYFMIDALNPGSGGLGAGAGTYNSGQQALIGIQPPKGIIENKISLYSNITASTNPIVYGSAFEIYVNVHNSGTKDFSGDFCAAAFDKSNKFVDFIEIKSDWQLPAGMVYQNNITFSTTGILAMLPGYYYIGIFYRPTGGAWTAVLNTAEYSNFPVLKVINQNYISLYSEMKANPPENIYQGKAFSVNVDIGNYSKQNFNGELNVALYELDGKFAKNIEAKTDMVLNSNSHYTNGLTFSISKLDVPPGTYLVGLTHKWNGGNWELTGSTDEFQNPILIIVQQSAINPDIYEVNNVVGSSTNLPLNFVNNSVTKKTTGSNIHIGSDLDYYKIDLVAGYSYTIDARLQDSQNSNDGNSYSVDAMFAYSTDEGKTWSDGFDDTMPSSIKISGAKTVYFVISPYFTGYTGTYQLDMNVSRTKTNGVDYSQIDESKISIYPNPASNFLTIDLSNDSGITTEIMITDLLGNEVFSTNSIEQIMNFDVNDYQNGVYFIRLKNSLSQYFYKSIIVNK